jgi:hypothetical protein
MLVAMKKKAYKHRLKKCMQKPQHVCTLECVWFENSCEAEHDAPVQKHKYIIAGIDNISHTLLT